jgi:curved DNA-binding protein
MRLKGRGIPGKPPGDFFVVLRVALPPADSQKAKKLYEEMKQKMPFNPRAKLGV